MKTYKHLLIYLIHGLNKQHLEQETGEIYKYKPNTIIIDTGITSY